MKLKFIAAAVLVSMWTFVANASFASDIENTAVLSSGSVQAVTLSADTAYSSIASSYSGNIEIKGTVGSEKLTLPSEISLSGNLSIDKVVLSGTSTIYANGYTLEIGSSATSDSRLTVYGGKKNSALTGDTNLILLGGLYNTVYGGGYAGAVNGNTNVILGGNANAGDSIDDSSSSISPCYVYGGGNNATVTGKTNVTLKGNAVTKYLVGAGTGTNGTAVDTNINIDGGKVMNVYAGSRSVALTNCNTHITMTGGMAEALFGGCEAVSMTGNTYITVKGGEVTRRIYTGCYNNWTIGTSSLFSGGTWSSDNYVTGTTTLSIYPAAKLNTGTGLSDDNKMNTGVFAGSRTKSSHSNEKNTLIYMNNCYSTHSQYLGEKSKKIGISLSRWLKSFESYTIKAGVGGTVYGTDTAGSVRIVPDEGYYGLVGGSGVYINTNATVSGTSEITFKQNFAVNSVVATAGDGVVNVDVGFASANVTGEKNPRLYVAVWDESGNWFGGDFVDTSSDMTSKSFALSGSTQSGKTYSATAYIWDENLKPLIKEISSSPAN